MVNASSSATISESDKQERKHLAIFASGAGSNAQKIIEKTPPESPSSPSITPPEYAPSMTKTKNGIKNIPIFIGPTNGTITDVT